MVSIVKQTWQERYDMYMKLTKEELARMMAENDRITNPNGCTDAIYINSNKPYLYENHFSDNSQASAPEIVKDNCVASNSSCSFDEYTDNNGCRHESYSYTYDEFISDDNPTGITYIG